MGGLAQNVQKTPPGKNVQKSQGQIFQEFQECQGQMPRSNAKVKCQGQMPRSNVKVKFPKVKWENKNGKNPKVKYFRNLWNVWNVKVKFPKVKWENKNGKPEKTGKKPEKTGKMGKMGNGKMGKCNKNKKPKTLKEILIMY